MHCCLLIANATYYCKISIPPWTHIGKKKTSITLTKEALASCLCVRCTTWSHNCCPLMLRELVRGLWVTIRTSWAQSSISRCKSSGRSFSLAPMDAPVYVPVLLLLLLAWAWASPITGWWGGGGGVAPVGGCCDWLKVPDPAADPERGHTHTHTHTPLLTKVVHV